MDSIEVVAIGSEVSVGEGLKAEVTAICLRGDNRPSYECVWWDGPVRYEKWLQPSEVTFDADIARKKVGFLSN